LILTVDNSVAKAAQHPAYEMRAEEASSPTMLGGSFSNSLTCAARSVRLSQTLQCEGLLADIDADRLLQLAQIHRSPARVITSLCWGRQDMLRSIGLAAGMAQDVI
jgi:hypothetical protein